MAEEPSITCPRCGMTSYNPNDIKTGYCGKCHAFTSRGTLPVVKPPNRRTNEEK